MWSCCVPSSFVTSKAWADDAMTNAGATDAGATDVGAPDAGAPLPCASGRHVSVTFDVALDAAYREETLKDLESELAPRGLTVCVQAREIADDTALAEVRIESRGPQRIAIEVFDRTTDKRVGRDLALATIGDNGRALATAIAIDELLRASWAELAMRDAALPPAPVVVTPPTAALEAPAAPKAERRATLALGAEATYARSFDHYDAFGGVVVLDALASRWFWLEARGGFSRALKQETSAGSVEVSGPSTALTFGACRDLGRRATRGCLGERTTLDLLSFNGDANSGQRGQSSFTPVLSAALVAQARVRLHGALALSFGAGAGAALIGARITDGSRTLARIDRLLLQSNLGLSVDL